MEWSKYTSLNKNSQGKCMIIVATSEHDSVFPSRFEWNGSDNAYLDVSNIYLQVSQHAEFIHMQ